MENQETKQKMTKSETKTCKYCQSEIAKKAKVCPNCRKKQGGIGKWIVIGIIVFLLFGAMGSSGESGSEDTNSQTAVKTGEVTESDVTDNTKEENSDSNETEEVENEFTVGDVVETEYLKISFLSAEPYTDPDGYSKPAEGKEYYRVEFEFENIGDTDQSVGSFEFVCYANGYAVDETWVGDDMLSATISPGKKAKGAIYYEIPVDATEITLEYETNFWTEDKIVFVIK